MKGKLLITLCIVIVSITTCLGQQGKFIALPDNNGHSYKAYAAGPEDARAAIIFVHDFLGLTNAAKDAVEKLGTMGYLTIGIDLYNGKVANTNDSANTLMHSLDSAENERILKAALNYVKKPGRKLASVGYSAGCLDAMKVNLLAPELFNATILVYGGNYDKIEKSKMETLVSPVLAITGSADDWPMQAAANFMANEKGKAFHLYIYPGAKHGYAQPLFDGGKNYDYEATRVTWVLTQDFLARHLK